MKRILLFLGLGLFVALPTRARTDPQLTAMLQELHRNQSKLQIKGFQKPYFISYALRDSDQFFLLGEAGSIFKDTRVRNAFLYVDCRVGSYQTDSSQYKGYELDEGPSRYLPGTMAPIDGNTTALRRALWLLNDYKYKQALQRFFRVRAAAVTDVDKDEPPAFSHEKPFHLMEPITPLKVNRRGYEAMVRKVTTELLKFPVIFDENMAVSASRWVRYMVNTEGTAVRTVDKYYGIVITMYSRAQDGTLLTDMLTWYTRTPDRLPGTKRVIKAVDKEAKVLKKLTRAPVLQPMTVPAIFMPGPAGVFFHETIGHRLEGQRQQGKNEGQTFRSYVGKKILPDFIDVYDDPTMETFQGVQLNGYYRVDDEGVPARRVTLVKNGVLKNFLMSRTPIKGFTRSNGHGRSNGLMRPVGRMGNLLVKASKTVSQAKLEKMLLQEARRQHKPFGVIIAKVFGGSTNTSTYGYQAFKGRPVIIYKVDAKTGKKTLVRGVDVVGTPLASIDKIVAASSTYGVFNGFCGAESGSVPVSAIAPAILMREVELQRSPQPKQRPLLLPPPGTDK